MTEPDLSAGWRPIGDLLADTRAADPQPEPAAENTVPPLTDGERVLLFIATALAASVSILGLLSSFTSLESKAGPSGWGWDWPWLLPVGMDLSIPAFTLAGLLLIRTDMPLAWVALVPRALTGATVYLNWSAATTMPGRIGHAVLTLLWVVFSEIAGHVYASQVGLITGKHMEKIRRIRWVLAPLSTLAIWRRMNLWEETSYSAALQRQRDRLLSHAGLREKYGRGWRSKAPRRLRVLQKLGDLNPADIFEGETNKATPRETETGSVETTSRKAETANSGETETYETTENETGLAGETARRETTTQAARDRETETDDSVYETETAGLAATETRKTTGKAERAETMTARQPRGGETKTNTVSRIGDRNPETEIQHLLGLMRDRRAETGLGLTEPITETEIEQLLGLKEAITETGRPKATAAKRLKAARDRYRAETAA